MTFAHATTISARWSSLERVRAERKAPTWASDAAEGKRARCSNASVAWSAVKVSGEATSALSKGLKVSGVSCWAVIVRASWLVAQSSRLFGNASARVTA